MDNKLSLNVSGIVAKFKINDIEVELKEKTEIELLYIFAARQLKRSGSKMLIIKDIVITDVSEVK
ncbi:MAG: hypothetical protein ACRDDY_10660 [Clostridium sp.]|uniref:hypothetical protein n=1 Tax=Clostridium sp. TaxID=1506 RepID=UPI003EE73C4B